MGALGFDEEKISWLQESDWPKDPAIQACLHLRLAEDYLDLARKKRSWSEPRRKNPPDQSPLSDKTRVELYVEASEQYHLAWKLRQKFGEQSTSDLSTILSFDDKQPPTNWTLRELITYGWAELLGNPNIWKSRIPFQEEQISTLWTWLDEGGPTDLKFYIMDDKHPLLQAASLLLDLQNWAETERHSGTVLECQWRLVQLSQLFNSYKWPERARGIECLRPYLEADCGDARYSMGQYHLANWLRKEDRLEEALAAATNGENAYPDSPGAANCFDVRAIISFPSLSIASRNPIPTTAPQLKLISRNLDTLYFQAYPLSGPAMKARFSRYLRDKEVKSFLEGNPKPAYRWSHRVNPSSNIHSIETTMDLPIKETGLFLVLASSDSVFSLENAPIWESQIRIGDWLLTHFKEPGEGMSFFVRDGLNGAPVSGGILELWSSEDSKTWSLHNSYQANSLGKVTILGSELPWTRSMKLMPLYRRGSQSLLGERIDFNGDRRTPEKRRTLFVFTDRRQYRPGESIRFKLTCVEEDAREVPLALVEVDSLWLSVQDPNYEFVDSIFLATDEFGGASGVWEVPNDAMYGQYRLGNHWGYSTFAVEAFQGKEFEIVFDEGIAPPVPEGSGKFIGFVQYLNGTPYSNAEIKYTLSRYPQYPKDRRWLTDRIHSSLREDIAEGVLLCTSEGRFEIPFTGGPFSTFDLDEEMSVVYELYASAKGREGTSTSRNTTLRTAHSARRLSILSEAGFFTAEDSIHLQVSMMDLRGRPISGNSTYRVFQVALPDSCPDPGEIESNSSNIHRNGHALRQSFVKNWPNGAFVDEGILSHGQGGLANFSWHSTDPGIFRIEFSCQDDSGHTFRLREEVYLSGGSPSWPIPLYLMTKLREEASSRDISILYGTGLPGKYLLFQVLVAGQVEYEEILKSDGRPRTLTLPYTNSMRGGLAARVSTLHNYEEIQSWDKLDIPWFENELKWTLEPDRFRLWAGGRETWTLRLNDGDSHPPTCDVLLAMVNRAVDSPTSNYSRFEYNNLWPSYYRMGLGTTARERMRCTNLDFPLGLRGVFQHELNTPRLLTSKSIGVKRGWKNVRIDAQACTVGPNSEENIGLVDPQERGKQIHTDRPGELRDDFQWTAFFLPQERSDSTGTLSFSFDVPDNLTSWRFHALALDRNMRTASFSRVFPASRTLTVRLETPEYLIEGDELVVNATANNASGTKRKAHIDLSILDDKGIDCSRHFRVKPGGKTIFLAPESKRELSWKVRAPKHPGRYCFQVHLRSESDRDAESHNLEVLSDEILVRDMTQVRVDGNSNARLFIPKTGSRRKDQLERSQEFILSVRTSPLATLIEAMGEGRSGFRADSPGAWDHLYARELWNSFLEKQPASFAPSDSLLASSLAAFRRENNSNSSMSTYSQLLKDQNEDGGFSEIPGTASTPVATLFVLDDIRAMKTALEKKSSFQFFRMGRLASSPADAWRYLFQQLDVELFRKLDSGIASPELAILLLHVLSKHGRLADIEDVRDPHRLFLEEDQDLLFDYAIKRWKDMDLYPRLLLVNALLRMNREEEARPILDSVLDLCFEDPNTGLLHLPMEYSRNWQNDRIAAQSALILALLNTNPEDTRISLLVQGLMGAYYSGGWNSPHGRIRAVEALIAYIERYPHKLEPDKLRVHWGNDVRDIEDSLRQNVGFFAWRRHSGVLSKDDLNNARIESNSSEPVLASLSHSYTTRLPAKRHISTGIHFELRLFRQRVTDDSKHWQELDAKNMIVQGDRIQIELLLSSYETLSDLEITAPLPSCFKPTHSRSGIRHEDGWAYYTTVRDRDILFNIPVLPPGHHRIRYELLAGEVGRFHLLPVRLVSQMSDQISASTTGEILGVHPKIKTRSRP